MNVAFSSIAAGVVAVVVVAVMVLKHRHKVNHSTKKRTNHINAQQNGLCDNEQEKNNRQALNRTTEIVYYVEKKRCRLFSSRILFMIFIEIKKERKKLKMAGLTLDPGTSIVDP